MGVKLRKEDFISKSKLIHGDKYDYSLVVYINNLTNVIIICPTHGNFEQRPSRHLSGSGCKLCGYISMSKNKIIKPKKCVICGKPKNENDFYKDKSNSDGFTTRCKDCIKLKQLNYRNKYKEIVKERNRIYEQNNRIDARNRYLKWYNGDNKKIAIKRSKKWKLNNKDRVSEQTKNMRLKKPYLFIWRNTVRNTLKRIGRQKEGKTIDILGYSALELKVHLEKQFTEGMSWDNYGEWHVDHIKPVSSFDKDTLINIVNSLSNLQPLWSTTREINGEIYIGNLNKGRN